MCWWCHGICNFATFVFVSSIVVSMKPPYDAKTVTPFGHHNAAAAASMPCLVDACTSRYRHSLEDIGSDGPSATVQYCLLLKNYRECLNDSFRHCLAQLDFHSATTTATRRWHRFECDRLIINAVLDEHRATAQAKCYVPELEEDDDGEEENDVDDADSAEDYYYDDENNSRHGSEEIDGTQKGGKMPTVCAMFGQLHLRPFHATTSSQIDQCSFVGARPFVDNPFFLIQITASDLLKINSSSGSTKTDQLKTRMLGITNIALIIRPKKGCVHDQKLYLADSGDQNALPPTFVDGTTNSGTEIDGKKQSVEIVQRTAESVRISLNYVDTEILIQNFGNRFFNIFVRLPSPKLIQSHFVSSSAAAVGHLCGQSCQDGVKFPENQAFLNRNGQINELCLKLVDRLSAKQSANNASRHNWISAICARDLAIAPTAMHFPMDLWLNSLFFAAEELDDEHGQFFNNKEGLIKKDEEDLATYVHDHESNAGRPKHLSHKNLNNVGTNAVFHTVPTFRASSALANSFFGISICFFLPLISEIISIFLLL